MYPVRAAGPCDRHRRKESLSDRPAELTRRVTLTINMRSALILVPLLLVPAHRATVVDTSNWSIPPAGSWLRDLWVAQGFLTGIAGIDKPGGSWPANISFGLILDEVIKSPMKLNRFVVNLGANDGSRHDPAFPLLVERGFGGIMVEGDPAFKKRLYSNMQPLNASGTLFISWGFASASAIGPRLLNLGCPREPDALKIDVDGLDAALLEGIFLANIRPKAVVVEVNPDLPPPARVSQLDHPGFTFEFLRKHMRGWLGTSADALYTLLADHGYAAVALELGTREHMVCGGFGKRRMCKMKHTCTHCENNMWFIRADLLRAAGVDPPRWQQFVHAFWKQTFAFNTYSENSLVFPGQAVRHAGSFSEADEAKPFTPACYSLSDHQYTKPFPGEPSFTKPACPLQTLKRAVEELQVDRPAAVGSTWRDWARLSVRRAKPAHASKAHAFVVSTTEAIKAPACRADESCPFNASAHLGTND